MAAGAGSGSNSATTVERAADILLLFASSSAPQLGVTEIAHSLGMSKSAVHRILASFRNKNLLELDPDSRKYALGPTILSLGSKYLGKLNIRKVAAGELAALSRETSETATLSVRTGDRRIYIDQVTPDREVLMSVQLGLAYPLHAGASSKAFLAFLPQNEIDRYLAGELEQVTDRTVTDLSLLREELTAIRARGWARSRGERQPGAGSVAAPVLDSQRFPLAVVSVCGPAERMAGEIDMCADHLLRATSRISARLGHGAPA
ncbi:MAG: IclR family transcriptional regulator [Streptosporangiaceae bacterium]